MGLTGTIGAIRPLDEAAMASARALQARLTKPAGSLGVLEELSVRLAGLAGACPPPMLTRPALAVFAGDHGVHAQGVTPWPQEVTAQMVANILTGGAVINAFARQIGATVTVVDIGVAADLSALVGADDPDTAGRATLRAHKVRLGTRDFTVEPALTPAEVVSAIEVGIAVARDLVAAGADTLLTGDMGIANTTPSATLIAAFTGADPAQVTGRGTGIDDTMFAHKTRVVAAALERHAAAPGTFEGPGVGAIDVLAGVGGLEHAALAGFILGGAALRVPVILDGVIACSSALAAVRLAPDAAGALVAGHRTTEPGSAVALAHLGLTPLVDLGLRLGEGSGAALAQPIVASAVRVLHEVATFGSAGVSEK